MKIMGLFLIQAKFEFSKSLIFINLLIAFVKNVQLNLKRNSKNFFDCPEGPRAELDLNELMADWISHELTWVEGGESKEGRKSANVTLCLLRTEQRGELAIMLISAFCISAEGS